MNSPSTQPKRGLARKVALLSGVLVALVAVALGAWWALGSLGSKGKDLELRNLGTLQVGVENSPGSPGVGENDLKIQLKDSENKPVSNADIEAVVFMSQMGSMPYMESRPQMVETSPGMYVGTYNLIMGGSWDIDITVRNSGGRSTRAALRLTVGTTGLTWVSESSDETFAEGDTLADGAIQMSVRRRQEIGVVIEEVVRRDLNHKRRAVGKVTYDETRLAEVNLKYNGWVRELRADFTGRSVRRGEVLFTVYSPELYSAQREFVEALRAAENLPRGASQMRAVELANAARQRLLLWDMTAAQVDKLETERDPQQDFPVLSPVSGVIVKKEIVAGSTVGAGKMLYRVAPLDPIWVMTDVYQYELPFLRKGQRSRIVLPYAGGADLVGTIAFVYPYLEGETRTGRVRIEVENPNLELKPDMFVDVEIDVALGEQIAVAQSAVIYSGERRIVFVDQGGGMLEPRDVVLGLRAGEYFAVVSGLQEGERVVTSGNFLIAAESRLRSAIKRW